MSKVIDPPHQVIAWTVLLILIGGLQPVRAQVSQAVSLHAVGDTTREVAPGETITQALQLTNPGTTVREVTPVARLPRGWKEITSFPQVTLAPSDTTLRLLTVQIPSNTPPGSYKIRCHTDTSHVEAAATVSVSVQPHYELAIRLIGSPSVVGAGEQYNVQYEVVNRGNTPADVHLSLQSSKGSIISPGAGPQTLKARERRSMTALVEAPSTADRSDRQTITVTGSIEAEKTVTGQAITKVSILPPKRQAFDAWHILPVSATVHAVSNGRQIKAQGELESTFPLSDDESRQLDFSVRAPGLSSAFRYGHRSRYRLQYHSERFQMRLGDYRYQLSPLLMATGRGLGGDADVRLGRWTGGVLYQQLPDRPFHQSDRGSHLGYRFTEGTHLRLHVLNRRGLYEGTVFSAENDLKIGEQASLNLEWGATSEGSQIDFDQSLYRAQLQGKTSWVNYQARYFHTGPSYPGTYHNQDRRSLHIVADPSRGLRLLGTWRDVTQGIGTSSQRYRYNRLYRLGARFSTAWAGGTADLRSTFQERRDDSHMSSFQREQVRRSLRTAARWQGSSFSAGLRTEHGLLKGYHTGRSGRYWAHRLSIEPVWKSLRMKTVVSYRRGVRLGQWQPGHQWWVYSSLAANLSRRSQLKLRGSMFWDHHGQYLTSLAALRWDHELYQNHRFTIRAQHRLSSSLLRSGGVDLGAAYTMPIDVPVFPNDPAPSITGRVVEVSSGEAMEGVIVLVDSRIRRTDSEGQFQFYNLKPGSYHLYIDPSSLKSGHLPVRKMPRRVTTEKKGRPSQLEIGVVQTGKLSGRIEWRETDKNSSLSSKEPADSLRQRLSLVIEAEGLRRKLQTSLDERGTFHFQHLPPGKWTIRIRKADLPPGYTISQHTYHRTVSSEEEAQVTITVERKQIKFEIIDSGHLD